ncbi:hypothetical protein IHE44_0006766 [Lamprotornis superbus]|uniref:Uncharacterized protein n=1 Tax=Lamprotornis superbus TaxID=245042 RepID=A0A835TRK9_9PASS|nr:hypothetical protein IHE44_0006766 [Lamprotornis superbus]
MEVFQQKKTMIFLCCNDQFELLQNSSVAIYSHIANRLVEVGTRLDLEIKITELSGQGVLESGRDATASFDIAQVQEQLSTARVPVPRSHRRHLGWSSCLAFGRRLREEAAEPGLALWRIWESSSPAGPERPGSPMDCPHLLHLGFLLLALAAPRPNIGMSIVGPAGGTEDYYKVVNVYRCRGCNSCKCENGENDFEKFEKIADAQNETFSDGIIELVTNKTHITFCFEEPKSCLKGTYGIFWEKTEGSGLPCGTPSSGENGRGDISAEKTICCEAETDTRKHNPVLNCFYTQKSHPKLNIQPAGIAAGNPEFLTSKLNSTVTLFAFLFVGVGTGWGTMYYCLRLRRRGQACRQDGQTSKEENIPLDGLPSTSEETSLPAASSSSSLRMYNNHLNTE